MRLQQGTGTERSTNEIAAKYWEKKQDGGGEVCHVTRPARGHVVFPNKGRRTGSD